MKKLLAVLIAIQVVIGFTACEKQTTTPEEKLAIEVVSPTSGANFQSGQNVNVKVTFTDPIELHNYSIKVTNETASTTVLDLHGHEHATSLTIDTTITVTVSTQSDFKLKTTVSNHSGDTESEEVDFQVKP